MTCFQWKIYRLTRLLQARFWLVCAVLFVAFNQTALAASDRFILKLKGAVELSASPTVRRLEMDGEKLDEVLFRNRVDAQWLRAGTLGTQVFRWGESTRATDQEYFLNRLRSDPDVEFAEPDYPVSAMLTPNDSRFGQQWALLQDSSGGGANFESAWASTHGGANVVVAVVDTGIVYNTPELAGRLLPGYDFVADVATANDGNGRDADPSDPGDWVSNSDLQNSAFSGCSVTDSSWHGTFIAGQIAANTNNGSGVAGADWNARILPIRVSGKCRAYSSDMFDGMLWAAGISVPGVPNNPYPADIINVSLGASASCSSNYQSAINRIEAQGTVITSSAGNSGGEVFLPANCDKVLSVGAVDKDGSRAYYSAIGNGVDLMAPGGYYNGLVGVGNSGKQGPSSANLVVNTGTSFSAPLVAAAAGLIKAARPDMSPAAIRSTLLSTARSFPQPKLASCVPGMGKAVCNCNAATCGAGLLDVGAAMRAAVGDRVIANPIAYLSGGKLKIDASDSSVASGKSIASYKWERVDNGNVFSDIIKLLDLPSQSSDWFFKLTVTDSSGQSHVSYAGMRASSSGDLSMGTTTVPARVQNTGSSTSVSQPSSGDAGNGSASSAVSTTSGGGGGGGAVTWFVLLSMLMLVLFNKKAANQAAEHTRAMRLIGNRTA